MSTTLETITAEPDATQTEAPFDLVQMLLAEQESMTAVERFSRYHDSVDDDSSAEPAQARYYRSLLPATTPAAGQQYAFDVDLDACSGCKACVVACHSLNGLEDDETWRRVGTVTIGQPESPRVQHVTTACHHCAEPGCLSGCPVRAYEKDPETGIVRHLDDQCIGCKYCTMMCPYEVPRYSERLGIVRKCDMCHQRLSVGEAPACVQSCPNEAISIRVVSLKQQCKDEPERFAADAPLSRITRPTTRYRSGRITLSGEGVPQDSGVDEIAESHWPLALMLVATQVSVGMLLFDRLLALVSATGWTAIPTDLTRINAALALLVAGAGMAVAPLHLGQPLRAWRVFLGLRTSWLSREAVVLGKYVGLLAAAVALSWLPSYAAYLPSVVTQRLPTPQLIQTMVSIAILGSVLIGIAGLYCSAMIYIATRRSVWRPSRTLTRFFSTAVIGGATGVLGVLLCTGGSATLVTGMALITAAMLAAKAVWEWKVSLGPDSVKDESLDRRSRALVRDHLGSLRILRLAMAGVGVVALPLLAFAAGGSIASTVLAALLVAGVVLVGESSERLLYFRGVVYDRMPGTMQ